MCLQATVRTSNSVARDLRIERNAYVVGEEEKEEEEEEEKSEGEESSTLPLDGGNPMDGKGNIKSDKAPPSRNSITMYRVVPSTKDP